MQGYRSVKYQLSLAMVRGQAIAANFFQVIYSALRTLTLRGTSSYEQTFQPHCALTFPLTFSSTLALVLAKEKVGPFGTWSLHVPSNYLNSKELRFFPEQGCPCSQVRGLAHKPGEGISPVCSRLVFRFAWFRLLIARSPSWRLSDSDRRLKHVTAKYLWRERT